MSGVPGHRGEPGGRGVRGSLQRGGRRLALFLVAVEGGGDVVGIGGAGEHIGEHDGVLERQLRPRPHREVGGVHRVAEQRHPPVVPPLAPHGGERAPHRGVADHAFAVEMRPEHVLGEGQRRLVGLTGRDRPGGVEPGLPPGLLAHLHDHGGGLLVERVAVGLHHAVRGLLEDEGERLEDLAGAQPDEPGAAGLDGGPEHLGAGRPGGAVDSVGGHHHVVAVEVGDGDVPLEVELGATLGGGAGEDLEQPESGDGGEPVPGGAHPLPAVMDVDVAPRAELGADPGERLRVGGSDSFEGLVGEHHPETERGVASVALEHVHLDRGGEPAEPGGQQQAAGAATDAGQAHSRGYAEAETRRWGLGVPIAKR